MRQNKRFKEKEGISCRLMAVDLILILCTIVSALKFFPITIDAGEKKGEVLLVCRRETDSAFLERMLLALECDPTVALEKDYKSEMLDQAAYVITTSDICVKDIKQKGVPAVCLGDACKNSGFPMKEEKNVNVGLESGPYSEWPESEKLIYSFASATTSETEALVMSDGRKTAFMMKKGNISYIPFYREKGLGAVMTGRAIAELLGKQEGGNMYLAVDEVYPFSDLEWLCSAADRLYENGIPFIVRVMPVYENLDYPAFERYAQALRYVQSRNGTVLLHPPVVREGEKESEPYEIKKERFTKALEEQKIFYVDTECTPYVFTWEEIRNINTTQKAFGEFEFDSMFTIPLSLPEEEFEAVLGQINDKWLTLSDYKQKFTDRKFQYYETPESNGDKDFFEREKEQANFEELFDKGDKILLLVVGGALFIFFILLGIGRKWYRRKFYR